MSRMMLTGRLRTVAIGLVGAGCVLLAAGCEADTEYIQLGAAANQAVAGSVASAKTGQAVDRACTAGK
jgi:hypothetical protein